MNEISYYRDSEVQDAMSVVAKWMGRNYGLKVIYHDGKAVDADIFNKVIRIPKLACSGGLTDEALMLLRGRVYHEAGHIAFTDLSKGEYPKGVLFEILNAIEDCRMEKAVSDEYPGTLSVFRSMHKYHNRKISERAVEGEVGGPIWEALVAMMFQSRCEIPSWRLSDKAKLYFDVAYDKFSEWRFLTDARGSVKLAEEVYELMREAHEEHKREQQDENSENSESSENSAGEDGGSSGGDFDDEGEDSGSSFAEDPTGSEEGADGSETVTVGEYTSGSGDAAVEMEGELAGVKLDELLDGDIEEALDDLSVSDAEYLASRDADEHVLVEGTDHDKETYKVDRESISTAVASMTSCLVQALRAKARCRKDSYKRRGKIDGNRLVQIAKNLSKDVFYQTRRGEKLDTAVEIVIDESVSMRSKYYDVRRAVIAMGEALSQVGIPFEVCGTTTKCWGSDSPRLNGLSRTNPLVYRHYKTFEQGWMSVCHNMSQSGARIHNVDGEAVEYCARRLASRPESRKIVISLSDGLPDAGHGNAAVMSGNLVRSCERARNAGIEVYGIGIKTMSPKKFYGSENFIYVNDVEVDLAKAFVEVVGMGVMGL